MFADIKIKRWEKDAQRDCADAVALEEPLEILVNGKSLAVTMRTPGDDLALAAGFLYAESVIRTASDIRDMHHDDTPGDPDRENRVHILLQTESDPLADRASLQRNFLATSSCGVCGKMTIAATQCLALPLPNSDLRVSVSVVRGLNDQMRAAQRVFDRTGGLHASGLFDAEGRLLALREDVGRHNALDKLIGAELLAGRVPLDRHILMVSGRASFELMQKAAMARIPVVCAVSAPSSLAVRLARDLNITLIGFLRGDSMNVYAGAHRLGL